MTAIKSNGQEPSKDVNSQIKEINGKRNGQTDDNSIGRSDIYICKKTL